MHDERAIETTERRRKDVFSPYFGCEPGRIDPTAWDVERGADEHEVEPEGWVS